MLGKYKKTMRMKRLPEHKIIDTEEALTLYLKGNTFQWICNKMNAAGTRPYTLTVKDVSSDVNIAINNWVKTNSKFITQQLAIELQKIALLESEYWKGYERVVAGKKRQKTKSVPVRGKMGKEIDRIEQVERTIEIGNVGIEWLKGIERCVKMRCDLLNVQNMQLVWQKETDRMNNASSVIPPAQILFSVKKTTDLPPASSNDSIEEAEVIS